jgi:hypothetical protein
MAMSYSPAGQALGFGADVTGGIPAESEPEKKKRLAAIAAAQQKIGLGPANGSALSPAGMALGLGGYASAVGG